MFKGLALVFMAQMFLLPASEAKADSYAVISYSHSTNRVGYSFNAFSLPQAEQIANSHCGVWDCHREAWVRNGCIAFSTGYNWGSGWGWNQYQAYAEQRALSECSLRDYGCTIRASVCTF